MTDIKTGDRVKVTFEATVDHVWADSDSTDDGLTLNGVVVGHNDRHDLGFVIEKIEPPVEVFKPGDRIRRIVDEKWSLAYEITLGAAGYIHHGAGDEFSEYTSGNSRERVFTSEKYERVSL